MTDPSSWLYSASAPPWLSAIDPLRPFCPGNEEVKTNLFPSASCRTTALAGVFGALVALSVPSHPIALAQGPGSSIRLQKGHLVYTGAFRLPDGDTGLAGFLGGGSAMSFDAENHTLWMTGQSAQLLAEVNIPDIRTGTSRDALATASLRTPFRDVLRGKLDDLQGTEAKLLGGTLPWLGDLIVSGYLYFEHGNERRSHFRVRGSTVTGPTQVGNAGAGFVSAWMTAIPPEWRGPLGGPALTGQGSIPIISRTSSGPAASVFNPSDIGVRSPVPATEVVGYPMGHQTLGTADSNGTLYSSTQYMAGMVFPAGTRSVLFFAGRKALGKFCYGPGTTNQSLHLTPYPGAPQTEDWCFDPVNFDKGTHGYPYAHFVYAYDANDLVAVRNGQKQPWEVEPYATWQFDLPFQYAQRVIAGVAYDPETKRVFLTAANGDGDKPLVHVFTIDSAASITTPTGPATILRRAPVGSVGGERRLAAPRSGDSHGGEDGESDGDDGRTTSQGSVTDATPAASSDTGSVRRLAQPRARATTPSPRDQPAPRPTTRNARRASPARIAECPGTNPFANRDGQIGVCVNGAWTLVPGIRTGGVVRQRSLATGEKVWLIETDEAVYEVAGGLGAAYQTDGLPVVFEGRFPGDVTSGTTGTVVIEIRQINPVGQP